jgi:hypothetical protein
LVTGTVREIIIGSIEHLAWGHPSRGQMSVSVSLSRSQTSEGADEQLARQRREVIEDTLARATELSGDRERARRWLYTRRVSALHHETPEQLVLAGRGCASVFGNARCGPLG